MRAYLPAILCATFAISLLAWQPASAASANGRNTPIFDGETLNGWTTTNGKPVTQGWEVVDGVIHLAPGKQRGGNIVTAKEYVNFDFRFEWKISPRGNSGIKYRVREYGKRTLGCEFQIIDDAGSPDGKKPKSSTGSLYDIYPPSANKYLNPVGEYNTSRIVIRGNWVQHWLNGQLIVSVSIGSCDWYQKKAQSKFKDIQGFSESRAGKIMLTDHNSEVWYRNLVIYELPEVQYRTRLVKHSSRHRLFGHGRLRRRCR